MEPVGDSYVEAMLNIGVPWKFQIITMKIQEVVREQRFSKTGLLSMDVLVKKAVFFTLFETC